MHTRFSIGLILTLLCLLGLSGTAHSQEDFLKPAQAFPFTGKADGPEAVVVHWRIADGYYLYKSKLKFRTDAEGFDLGYPDFPEAEVKDDEFFGEVEIYRGELTVRVPVRRSPAAEDTLRLMVTFQGCADAGLCYPPSTRTLLIELPPEPAQAPEMDMVQRLRSLTGLSEKLGLSDEEILPAEEAFRLSVASEDGTRLRAYFQIAEGTYLYREKLRLTLAEGDGVRLGDFELPPGEVKADGVRPDGSIGEVAVFHDELELDIPLVRTRTEATEILLQVRMQGCADIGICYPPVKRDIRLKLPAIGEPTASDAEPPSTALSTTTTDGGEKVAEQDRLAERLASGGLWAAVLLFFLAGLGLALTPCVFPMIPILSGIIAGQGTAITTRKAFVLSLVYVLAMAVTYTAAGVIAALFGQNLQAAFQNPWVLSGFAAVFVLLALSMFGFYDVQLPSRLQSRLADISNKQRGGNLVGVAVMGFLSALIVGPCVAPPLAAALIYIGQTGDALLGGSALFALSLGMGTPLIAIGTSAGKLLPRAGAWMDTVKAVFGVLMLAVTVYLLERIVPPAVALVLWGGLMIVSAVYLGALKSLPVEASGWERLWKGLGVILLVYGSLMLVGAAAGGRDTVQPLRGLSLGIGIETRSLAFQRIKTVQDLERELAAATKQGRPVMLDFYADWCTYCIQYEKYVFAEPAVKTALESFVLLQADVTANDKADQTLLRHLGIQAPPAILFFGPDGKERRNYRVVGYKDAEAFSSHIREAMAR
jgi:thiol:disulfide interchange protein DsbD